MGAFAKRGFYVPQVITYQRIGIRSGLFLPDFYTVLPDEVNRFNAKKGRGFAKAKYTRVII